MTSDGPRLAAFARRYVRHTKGRWAGQPLVFEPWKQEFWDEALEVDDTTGLRRYQEVLLGIPRKNSKSTMASTAGLYLLTSDGEEGPEVYATAAAKNQAGIVFGQARAFVDGSPGLQDWIRVRQYHLECPVNGGIFRVLASDAPLQHGLNPSGVIVDELHAHKSPDLYAAMTTGSGAREQPLTLTITTAGVNQDQVLGQIYNAALDMAGKIERRPQLAIVRDPDSGFLMYWYGVGPEDDLDDPAVWKGTNPASWITVDYLRRQLTKPTMRRSDFDRYHLNRWGAEIESWLPPGAWAAGKDGEPDPTDPLHGLNPAWPVAVGIDFGVKDDTTGIDVAQRWPMPPGRRDPETPRPEDLILIRGRTFQPLPDHGLEADIPGILDYLRMIRRRFPRDLRRPETRHASGPSFLYDPWGFKALAQILENEGLVMIEVPQTDARMVPVATDMYGLVMAKRIRHDGDPVLAHHIGNVLGRSRGESGWRITKLPNSPLKIDRAISSSMAVHEALRSWRPARVGAFVA